MRADDRDRGREFGVLDGLSEVSSWTWFAGVGGGVQMSNDMYETNMKKYRWAA